MGIQTQSEAETELALWYDARKALRHGRSFTITTSAGTRTLTRNSIEEVQRMIEVLERKVAAGDTGHNFALADFSGHDYQE